MASELKACTERQVLKYGNKIPARIAVSGTGKDAEVIEIGTNKIYKLRILTDAELEKEINDPEDEDDDDEQEEWDSIPRR